ncbi:related to amidase [Cephalotrichum gorgonifer]|uniref:Related to amidase n=1 Tax=Cephalotrichum gorgonifer TaxID=2041049 RepID=A0AAE8SV57_9PEZI|nr:related to amidase [Cephalotrichum gorgonifer]
MAPKDFLNYPEPVDWTRTWTGERISEDNNPVMKGLNLAIGASLVSNLGFLQRQLWNNAKFGGIKHMPELDLSILPRLQPYVIPLGSSSTPILPFEKHITTPAPADLAGRFHSAADFHAAYKSKSVTPLQVVRAILARSKRGQTPRSKYDNAWVPSYGAEHQALEAARESTERYARGEERGLLDGVPFGVKDDLDVEGYVSHHGMRYDAGNAFFKESEKSIWAVKKMEEAGAIMVGKLAMHELGVDTSGCNPAWGTPTNWANPAYYPGGSSSGPASALGSGLIPIAIGTDAGGSVRIPPCFNGVYGLKPTHHRLGTMHHSLCVTGPMAATVADLTAAYRTTAQPNPDCAVQGFLRPSQPPAPGAKKTLGIYPAWNARAAPEVRALCDAAISHYKTLGYSVVEITIPYLREAHLAHGALCITDMSAEHYRRAPTVHLAHAMLQPQTKVLVGIGSQTPAADYLAFNQLRELMMQHVAHLFAEHENLLIVTPTTPMAGWPKGAGDEEYGFTDANVTLQNMLYVVLANMTGCPAVTAPVGYVDPVQGLGKVPIGLMAMGEWGTEEALLAWAGEAEAYLAGLEGGRIRPRAWVDVLEVAGEDEEAKKGDTEE